MDKGEMVLAKSFTGKFRSKYEVWKFLVQDVKAYLPPNNCMTGFYYKDIMMGKRRCKFWILSPSYPPFCSDIKTSDVEVINVPQYEHLTIADLWEWGAENMDLDDYFPIEQERRKLPKWWIANMLRSIHGEDFEQWVDNRVDKRNDKLKKEGNREIKMDPAIHKAYQKSTHVSSK